jgi:hypothetical protein
MKPLAAAEPSPSGPPFKFDRYINGVLMAEGVTIDHNDNLRDAMITAASIAPRGKNGETPVLIFRPEPSPSEAVAWRCKAPDDPQGYDYWTAGPHTAHLAGIPGREPLYANPAPSSVIEALKEARKTFGELMATLRKEAPDTPLNNHRFDALGIRAYDALAKIDAALALQAKEKEE